MLNLNQVYLLSNLSSLQELLENSKQESLSRCIGFYEDKIAIQYSCENNSNTICIWKTKVLFDYWYNSFDQCGQNLIATLNYSINDSFIKINHLYINDGRHPNLYNSLLDENESEDLVKWLIHYLKKITILLEKKKITMDVHENLRIFEKYYYYIGFELTNQVSKDNPFWLEVELSI